METKNIKNMEAKTAESAVAKMFEMMQEDELFASRYGYLVYQFDCSVEPYQEEVVEILNRFGYYYNIQFNEDFTSVVAE